MNLFLVWITAFIRRKEYTPLRWLIASAVVAFLSLIYKIRLLTGNGSGHSVLYIILSITLLTTISYTYKGHTVRTILRTFVKDVLLLLFCTILTAGGLLLLRGNIENGKSVSVMAAFFLMVVSFVILCVLFVVMRNIIKSEAEKCETILKATLIQGDTHIMINVLYDTGNNLSSPYTNEPVNIISEKTAVQTGIRDVQKPLLIPYNSIGGSGMLETFRFEKLIFQNGEVMLNFLGALSKEIDDNDDIQMILNCSSKKIEKSKMQKGGQNGKDINAKQISF